MVIADEPGIDIAGETVQAGDTFDIDGVTYNVSELEGGSGTIEYQEVVEQEETWENESTIEWRNGEYQVIIESGDDPTSVTIEEVFDVEAILANDSQVDNQTYERDDGTEFVRYTNGTTQPLEAYLPDSDPVTAGEGDRIEHDNSTKTIANISAEAVTLGWEEEVTQSVNIDEGDTFELGDQEYVATFPDAETAVISTDIDGYDESVENQTYFEERLSGLLYVIVFSLGSAFLIAAMAFLPHRG